jgi:hypothetical protein
VPGPLADGGDLGHEPRGCGKRVDDVAGVEALGELAPLRQPRSGDLLALALELGVPPLSLLTLVLLVVVAVSEVFRVLTSVSLPLWLASTALLMLVAAVLLSWARYGRQVITFGELASVPFYALRKIPLYLRFLFKRQVDWVRSSRGAD